MTEMRDYIVIKLKEMGFDEEKIERACNSTTCESLDQVMEWIIVESEKSLNSVNESKPTVPTLKLGDISEATKCEADKLSNADSGESSVKKEVIKTPEEIEAEKRRYEEKIKQRRIAREQEERQQEIEKEKSRRQTGSEISKYREQYETQEKIRIAQEIRREKLEKEAHKKAVLEQIRKDREAMKRENQSSQPSTPSTSGSTPNKVVNTGSSSTECRLAIRLPDGKTLLHTFTPNEQLAAVRLYIQLNRKDLVGPANTSQPIKLIMPPNKVFTEDDMERTLLDLGLHPSARLIVADLKKPL
ncbi:UBX domain-containing protein 1 [Tetranychus urticae]|nr:UBX domain-containing protein 1 [Tetranychus urticae]XP_015788021.1 UBX domain-containing protein 1 [Tetranychus urticae]